MVGPSTRISAWSNRWTAPPTSRAVAATGLSTAKRRRFRCAACLTTSGLIASGRTCCSQSSRRCRSRYARPPQSVAACPSYPPMRSHNLPTLRTKCSTRISALTPGHVRRSGPLLCRFRGRGDAESHWSARITQERTSELEQPFPTASNRVRKLIGFVRQNVPNCPQQVWKSARPARLGEQRSYVNLPEEHGGRPSSRPRLAQSPPLFYDPDLSRFFKVR